ncbi:EF-hand domain-containing protein [Tamlana sp. 2_MG-2023]|uniref:EF-hand domain-containing protein n=1 Tax=unclassified Tamlana TaxID=2614803 RepID=UPI0026E16787|nr:MULTISPECIES: EF-hand domain-containing protein [unclassified Tamlana]MDO6760218.1 EF-hand domain-containing protein [Tamlana sp. 2_MG-2023]MDO6790084.1 EF-hand domain-containing protein [Tamlana sp. 1_MG-2023]
MNLKAFNTTDRAEEWLDGQSQITNVDFYIKSFDKINTNGDDKLSSQEWKVGATRYTNYIRSKDYNEFDTDKNGAISSAEYYSNMANSNYFSGYDMNHDNKLTKDEINQGMFKEFDKNNDGTLDENEFDREY